MKKSLNWLFDYPDLQVYQYEEGFKFSLDSILLAEFADIKASDNKILDLCTGNGVIPIILHQKYHKKVIGVEVQKEIYELACDSVLVNHMSEDIQILHKDVMELKNYFPGNNFDVILCNPPYFKTTESSIVNDNVLKRVARHEVLLKLEDLIEIASSLLKSRGKFYLVHVPDRIDEIIVYAHKYGFGVKEIQFVHSKIESKPIIVLFTLVKDAKFGTKVYAPKVIQGISSYQGIFERS